MDHGEGHDENTPLDRPPTKPSAPFAGGERKQVTVLFSDLSGYTSMSGRLDPEELREVMNRIFTKASRIIGAYGGHVEALVGDALMVLFGYPQAHEDAAVRAIKSAREIHAVAAAEGERIHGRIGKPLRMHSGINTGLVVTGERDLQDGLGRVWGDTVNVASRLADLAEAGEILVGAGTKQLAERLFDFEPMKPVVVKGKEEPLTVWRVVSEKEKSVTVHRLSGKRARLIGRQGEMARLQGAVELLQQGNGSVVSLVGEAGTGKSRLAAEFRATLGNRVRWLEGRSYSFSQNMPYFLLVNLLGQVWGIATGDHEESVRERVEKNLSALLGDSTDVAPFIGGIFGLKYPELRNIDGEFWKKRVHEGGRRIFSALSAQGPTVWCFEDLHWADPSSLDLLRSVIAGADCPAVFLCLCRPGATLLRDGDFGPSVSDHLEIHLRDLSLAEAREMLGSLLETERLPLELTGFLEDKAEGNPFYLEEVVNSLIESATLVRHDGGWRLTRPVTESEVPLTIDGVIAARLDRLELETKRILQEAAVIGRTFLYDILKQITDIRERLTDSLERLETADLVRKRSRDPVLEYIFKHALTQDVAYNGLLNKERQEIHERIGEVIEAVFQDRLPEFFETLAFHFSRGRSLRRAVEYLIKAGEKSQRQYALAESHSYYQQAYDLLRARTEKTAGDMSLMVDLLCRWAMVFYYRGDYTGLEEILARYREPAEAQADKSKLGLFYAWLGEANRAREKYREAYDYLQRAVRLGEETGNGEVVAYACQALAWLCPEMGLFEEGRGYAARILEILETLPLDPFLRVRAMGALGYADFYAGEAKKACEAGRALLEYGERNSNVRSVVMGHWIMGFGRWADGDFPDAIRCCETAVRLSVDPHYAQFPKTSLGAIYLANKQFREAERISSELIAFGTQHGSKNISAPAQAIHCILRIVKGDIARGLKDYEELQRQWLSAGRMNVYAMSENIIGSVYLNLVLKSSPVSWSTIVRNLGFLARNLPRAAKKAESHFAKAIDVATAIGAKGTAAQAYHNLGLLHGAKGKRDRARECLGRAIELFERCEASTFLKKSREALQALG